MSTSSLYIQTILALVVMAGAYVVSKLFKFSTEISLFFAVVAGAIYGGAGFDTFRHLAEGSIAYFDIGLIFLFATLFMNIIKESGGTDYIVRGIIKGFYNKKYLMLILLMVVMLVPGSITGAGSISVMVVGGTVSSALVAMGLGLDTVSAIIFLTAAMSAVAPPINVWAMMTCACTAIPYVGFTFPLLIPVIVLGLFSVLFLGRKAKNIDRDVALKNIPEPKGLSGWSVGIPFLVLIFLLTAPRIWPFDFPVMGLPLNFAISALVAFAMNFKRIKILKVIESTIDQVIPLLATTAIVGMLLQVISFNGVKGLISMTVVTMPVVLLFILLPAIIPVSEAILTYGSAALIGAPLVWMLNSRGYNAVLAIAGLSFMWALGDALPPTALIGRLSVSTAGYTGKYSSFLKKSLVPWIAITAVGLLMIIFSNQLSFLMFS